MTEKMSLDEIRRHWEQAARRFPDEGKGTPTSRDPYLGQLEEQFVLEWLGQEHVALEIGPGDASHSAMYARKVKMLSGIDISEGLIRLAEKRMVEAGIDNVRLSVGSVLELKNLYQSEQFDRIISQRCLINLPEWSLQKDAIAQVHRLLRKDGLFLLAEGFRDGLENLNSLRQAVGLTPMQVVGYNRMMVRRDFEEFVTGHFDIIKVNHFGLYMFLSRVFHPLAVLPDEPRHDSHLNEAAMRMAQSMVLPEMENYSTNLFYVLRKK